MSVINSKVNSENNCKKLPKKNLLKENFNEVLSVKKTKSSIIIVLGQNLKIFRISQKLVKIGEIKPQNNFLNLDLEFENLWQNLWPIISLEFEIFYLTLPENSFTSARIVYLWLQSWQMFANFENLDSKKFYIHNFKEKLTLEIWENGLLEIEKLAQILDKIRFENNQKLIYSASVRIGQSTL